MPAASGAWSRCVFPGKNCARRPAWAPRTSSGASPISGCSTTGPAITPGWCPSRFTLEPCESYSRDDMDEYVAVLGQIAREAYDDPEFVKNAPYRAPIHRVPDQFIDDPARIAVTWRQYLKKDLSIICGQ